MSESKEVGLVVKILDYDDYDQVVTIITSDEVLSFIALGVRKINSKNRIALQLGNIIEVELFRARLKGKLSKLKRSTIVMQPPIKELDTANVLLLVIKYLSRIQNSPGDILTSIFECFHALGSEYNHHIKVFILFNYLKTIGENPQLSGCIECGSMDHIIGFEFYKGGYTCVKHTKEKRSLEFLKAIQVLDKSFNTYKETDSSVNKLIFKELEAFIEK